MAGDDNAAKYAVILKVLRKNREAKYADIKADPDWTWTTAPAGPSVNRAKIELRYVVAGEKPPKKGKVESNGLTPTKIKAAIALVQDKFGGNYDDAKALADAIGECGSVDEFKEALDEAGAIAKLFKG